MISDLQIAFDIDIDGIIYIINLIYLPTWQKEVSQLISQNKKFSC